MFQRKLCALCVLVVACGPHHTGTVIDGGSNGDAGIDAGPLPHTLESISVTPTNPLIELDLNTTAAQGFTVTGMYADGSNDDLTAQATFVVANPAVGAMTGSTLAIPAFTTASAVVSKITATAAGLSSDAQITVVAYRKSGPTQDFFFILPYQDPGGPVSKPLDFSTNIPALDVFFLVDTTGSMAGEIQNLQSALTGTVVPGIASAVANSAFGVGALEDFPVDPFGSTNGQACGSPNADTTPDQPFKLRQEITTTTSSVQAAVNGLSRNGSPIGCGNDWPEGGLEAIYQISTGEGLTGPAPTSVPANHDGIGGVAFRPGTMPVIVDISDAQSHGVGETGSCPTTGDPEAYSGTVAAVAHSRAQTKAALANICARVVGVAAIQTLLDPSCSGEAYMTDLATTTGARVPPAAWDVGTRPAGCGATQCCTGQNGTGRATDADGLCPVVFEVTPTGTGVSASVVTGVQMLTRFAQFNVPTEEDGVTTDTAGNPLPAPHTTADFLKAVTPTTFTLPPAPPVVPSPTHDANQFIGVTPGTHVQFAVNAYNDFVPATSDAQIFQATIKVLAGGCQTLDQRDVLILVPPMPVGIQ